jgi:hypothetical protein
VVVPVNDANNQVGTSLEHQEGLGMQAHFFIFVRGHKKKALVSAGVYRRLSASCDTG